MAHQQSWPLSQDANKNSGTCSCCFAVRQLHIKDGTVHLHGPRSQPCPGSRKPPASQTLSNPPTSSSNSQTTFHSPNTVLSSHRASATATPDGIPFDHPSVKFSIIKHIPKSARPACCTALSRIL